MVMVAALRNKHLAGLSQQGSTCRQLQSESPDTQQESTCCDPILGVSQNLESLWGDGHQHQLFWFEQQLKPEGNRFIMTRGHLFSFNDCTSKLCRHLAKTFWNTVERTSWTLRCHDGLQSDDGGVWLIGRPIIMQVYLLNLTGGMVWFFEKHSRFVWFINMFVHFLY